ncbi:hypothetical protein Zmor_001577 [Zophobas morio]|uniref:Elongation of very long chain fatty acids protein n=1 Tax=Zophobas morio TaxID=2755281 RepID=A0AA38IYP9_9CUCU|nr:hypothetical protein Zmor_001577 [Zophobas morio]
MASFLVEKYFYVLDELGDPRLKDWITVSSPGPTLTIIAIYILLTYVCLPAYMKHRAPYNLKTFLYFYNIFQIVYCLGILYVGLTSNLTIFCQPVDYSTNSVALQALHCTYYTFVLKAIELIETPIFVLRKKYQQVSKLHVYHHISTFVIGWVGVRFVAGGMVLFPIMINTFLHVLMYTYYLLSSLGKEWQMKLEKWKPRLTMLQMVQFMVMIVHSMQSLHPECHIPKPMLLIYLPNVFVVFYMFWEFYQKNYIDRKKD